MPRRRLLGAVILVGLLVGFLTTGSFVSLFGASAPLDTAFAVAAFAVAASAVAAAALAAAAVGVALAAAVDLALAAGGGGPSVSRTAPRLWPVCDTCTRDVC